MSTNTSNNLKPVTINIVENSLRPNDEDTTYVGNGSVEKQRGIENNTGHGSVADHPTSYLETLMHLLRGNIGSGVFAMGDAFKNGGLILSSILTVVLGVFCVHSQHILINCSQKMKKHNNLEQNPDFAQTVELCFECGPPILSKNTKLIRLMVNLFLCITQLGFCCIYMVFISSNVKQVVDYYGYELDIHAYMAIILVPVLLPSLLTNLKILAPFSAIANVCMATSIGAVFYFALTDIPNPSERQYVGELSNIPLYFGTAIFAFEGIGLVLPLKASMRQTEKFDSPFGVLNIGMTFVALLYLFFGFFGYLKWGEDVGGSLTLNLPQDNVIAQVVKSTVSVGMLLTYPLQFFVAIQILWSRITNRYGPMKRPLRYELLFRTIMVLVTFVIAEFVPYLNLFISLIGALCATALALVLPPMSELVSTYGLSKGPGFYVLIKNITILLVALCGFLTGTYESCRQLYLVFAGIEDET